MVIYPRFDGHREWLGIGDWTLLDDLFAALDVCGYNYEYRKYRPDHERHPGRVICGSESAPKEAFENWREAEELNHVIGDFVWTSLDYLGESGIGRVRFDGEGEHFGAYPWHQANCGDLDLCGWKRPQSYYRDILWHRGDKLHLAVHPDTHGANADDYLLGLAGRVSQLDLAGA